MAKEIIMPKFEMAQEEATIIQWLKQEGDLIEKGEPILEVETDKVNMEVEAPAAGTLGGVRYAEGEVVPVTVVIAYVLDEGEEAPPPPDAKAPKPKEAKKKPARAEEKQARPTPAGKVRATPVARRLAGEHDLDLGEIEGSGPRGRVQRADVEAAIEEAETAPEPARAPSAAPEAVPLAGMRRTIAQRMQASYQQAPHVMFTLDVDMTEALAFRAYARARAPEDAPISMTAVLVMACTWALRQHPMVNSHFKDDQILKMPDVNIGVAVALEEGLIVPVVHHADRLGLVALGAAVDDLATRARADKLRPHDVAGGTFTISNLGMFGVDHFTAIINPPQVAILAVGRIAQRFVPDAEGAPAARPMMSMTLSVDHRALDGAMAAQFLTTLRRALEDPLSILL